MYRKVVIDGQGLDSGADEQWVRMVCTCPAPLARQ